MRLVLAIALFALVQAAFAAPACVAGTVYLVRHAEKAADGSDDPPLSAAGQRNAQALVAWFEGKPLDAIYATHLRRTQQTALPLATVRDLDLRVLPAANTAGLIERLRTRHCEQAVLVVGHSNTVPAIVNALGGPKLPDLCDASYATMFVFQPARDGRAAQLVTSSYGTPDAPGASTCAPPSR